MADRPRRSTAGRRTAVIAAAVDLVDAEGIEGLSMRRLAARLGVTPMALYNHVAGRHDLITGIVDRVLGGVRFPDPDESWQRRLRGVFIALRQAYLEHPNVVPLIQTSATVTAAQLRPMETALRALVDAGLSPADARHAWTALVSLTNGHVAYQLQGHIARTSASTLSANLDARDFPLISATLADADVDFEVAFEAALDALVNGLTQRGRG